MCNIYAVSVADAKTVPVTSNELRGISFSAVDVLMDGRICYSQSELRRDISLARRSLR
jgi:hypothetical protein